MGSLGLYLTFILCALCVRQVTQFPVISQFLISSQAQFFPEMLFFSSFFFSPRPRHKASPALCRAQKQVVMLPAQALASQRETRFTGSLAVAPCRSEQECDEAARGKQAQQQHPQRPRGQPSAGLPQQLGARFARKARWPRSRGLLLQHNHLNGA